MYGCASWLGPHMQIIECRVSSPNEEGYCRQGMKPEPAFGWVLGNSPFENLVDNPAQNYTPCISLAMVYSRHESSAGWSIEQGGRSYLKKENWNGPQLLCPGMKYYYHSGHIFAFRWIVLMKGQWKKKAKSCNNPQIPNDLWRHIFILDRTIC